MRRAYALRRRYGRAGDDPQKIAEEAWNALSRAWWAAAEAQAPVEYEAYRDALNAASFHNSKRYDATRRSKLAKLKKAMADKGIAYPEKPT